MTNSGEEVYISKISRLKDGKTLDRRRSKIKELTKNDVPITNSYLRKFDIGVNQDRDFSGTSSRKFNNHLN